MKAALLAVVSAALLLGAGCDTVDLGAPPADVNACMPGQMWFVDQIWPNFLGQDYNGKHCYDSACHGTGSKTPLTLVNPGEPATFPLPDDWANDYVQASQEMNCSDVLDSPLLLLPEGVQVHGGGQLIDPNSQQAMDTQMLLETWVTSP